MILVIDQCTRPFNVMCIAFEKFTHFLVPANVGGYWILMVFHIAELLFHVLDSMRTVRTKEKFMKP